MRHDSIASTSCDVTGLVESVPRTTFAFSECPPFRAALVDDSVNAQAVSDTEILTGAMGRELFSEHERRPPTLLYHIGENLQPSELDQIPHRTLTGLDTRVSRSLFHLPTQLIEYWFSHVCPIWSAFDSHINLNRQIASMTWSTSGAVFNALQHMSVAHMMHQKPEMGTLLPTIASHATNFIKTEISRLGTCPAPTIRSDLVFAVLALGTSLHWTDCNLDASWLNDIRMLLDLWKQSVSHSPSPDLMHAYFCQAAVYWQMLMCPVVDEISHEGLNRRRRRYEGPMIAIFNSFGERPSIHSVPGTDLLQALEGSRPNSWCGVSCEVIDMFGQVLALCREARNRERKGKFTLRASREAIRDIQVAKELQVELIALDVQMLISLDELSGLIPQTGDTATPIAHLLLTADAYRKASLLQLYLTFEDLDIDRARRADPDDLPPMSDEPRSETTETKVSRARKLFELALEIVSILGEIPVASGARSMQPILYLTVAPGLKFLPVLYDNSDTFNTHTPAQIDTNAQSNMPLVFEKYAEATSRTETAARDTIDRGETWQPCLPSSPPGSLPSQIKRARTFIVSRISTLRTVLPKRPMAIITRLVDMMWRRADLAITSGGDCH